MPFAEVIASNTRQLVAEVYKEQPAPAFGSWVAVPLGDGTVLFALVAHLEHGSIEPGRQAMALGLDREALRREMPQVLELIRTTFRAFVLAYRDVRGRLHQTLPPRPADLHAAVEAAPPDIVSALGEPYDYLRSLAKNPDPAVPADDLLVAVLQERYRAFGAGQPEATEALIDAGRALARVLNNDHERLQSILRRVG